jgi:hypothetical protein
MLHMTRTQGSHGDSQLLMVKSQITDSFAHNLCFDHPSGSHKPILDIYVPKVFQWYKKPHNPMGFDPCNHFLKIWESIRTLMPKVGVHLGVWGFIPSHSPTFLRAWNVIPGLHSGPTPLQALVLIMNPRLGLRQWGWMKTSMTCLHVLIVLNQNVEFHVHINASNFSLSVMLQQNPDNIINKSIYYISRLMNSVIRSYSTTNVTTLALGSWPRQGLAKVWAKNETQEVESMRECENWTCTFPSELPLWELESQWTPKSS